MRRFAALVEALDASTATHDKLDALQAYLLEAPEADAAWCVYFLCGGKPRQVVPTALLRQTACSLAGIDDWLFESSYQAVGDLAETIAHVLPPPRRPREAPLAHWVEERLLPLRGLAPPEQQQRLSDAFDELQPLERFLLVKLIGGGFRVGVSRLLVQRALAAATGLDPALLAQRLVGWTARDAAVSAQAYRALVAPAGAASDHGAEPDLRPYPFFLAHALEAPAETLGPVADWLAEWKYDGIRAQLVRRAGGCSLWSRGEELITDRFPEVVAAAQALPPGTVLDGELLAWREGDDGPLPFVKLQQRVQRKTLPRKLLADVPAVFVAYDLLESEGTDRRGEPQRQRRERLQALNLPAPLRLSPLLPAGDWPALAAQRERARGLGVEGLMLKSATARYGSGRTRSGGVWWKWKVEPFSVDAVLIYAQAGHGRRAGLYTDYTFAVWNRPPRDAAEARAVVEAIAARRPPEPGALQLVAFAKAYSGLSDAEFAVVDREIRAHTLEKFGPVRSVRPTLVFELGFEGIARSPRHKSGVAVRFPRMLRIRHDKPLHEADTLPALEALLAATGSCGRA